MAQNDYQRYVRFDELNTLRNNDHDGAHFTLAQWLEYAALAKHFGYMDTFGNSQARIAQLGLTIKPNEPDEDTKFGMWHEGYDAHLMASNEGYYADAMASLEAAKEAEREAVLLCGVSIKMGLSWDPYMTSCTLDKNHEGPHQGGDPFGGDQPLEWTGGGSCAGDPLPFSIVR